MKVVLIGLPHFTRLTARFLSDRSDGSDTFVAIDTSTRGGKLHFLLELPSADTVFSHWGTLTRSRALDLSLRLRKRVVQLWAGSDVLDAIDASRTGSVSASYIRGCVHLCEAPWTRDELARVGVRANVVPVAPIGSVAPDPEAVHDPAEFSILAYVGKGRESFYGLPHLTRLAVDFPDVAFRIAGTDSCSSALPPNVELLGWVDDGSRLYRDCAVFVRIPDHDGFSYSVREALAWGRHVVSSYGYPHCLQASDYSTLNAHVRALKTRFDEGTLQANRAGRNFVIREFDDTKVLSGLVRVLRGTPS